jgi:protein-S-isoprenylcysteine O-methyltransferase Ste14
MDVSETPSPAGWIRALNSFNTYIGQDLLGGRRIFKTSWAINSHKILTPFVIFALMLAYQNYSSPAWLYLSLHGSYCICWLIKHVAFRDPRFEVKVTVGGAVCTFLFLALYWLAPFLLISGLLYDAPRVLPNWLSVICIALVVIGTTLMMSSDCQKRFTLRYRPGLITEGLFRKIRHPNYLGEMMVYAGFALIVGTVWPWFVLAFWWICVFLVNMYVIEASLSRYPGWLAYKDRSGMLFPKLF